MISLNFESFLSLLTRSSKPSTNANRTLIEENFSAVGVHYYESNIQKLACQNPDWKLSAAKIIESGKAEKKIFRYNYINKPVKLQPEPNNQHDKNAVAVIIAGELVGYISREENVHVKTILQRREVKSISGFIGGGEYKVISKNKDVSKFDCSCTVNIRIKYI